MAENIVTLHPAPVKRPKTSAERGRAFRERQKNKSAIGSAQPLEKTATFANVRERPNAEKTIRERPKAVHHNGERWVLPPSPAFAELEKSTAELVAACKRGIDAARHFRSIVLCREVGRRAGS